jgi:mono/diheme cytochrome c family protein
MRAPVRVVDQAEYDKFVTAAAGGGGDESSGETVFATAGCGGCHAFEPAGTDAEVGPSLNAIEPEGGMSLEDFVHESIVDPNAVITGGYQGDVMPNTYDKSLTDEQIDALVQYLVRGQK